LHYKLEGDEEEQTVRQEHQDEGDEEDDTTDEHINSGALCYSGGCMRIIAPRTTNFVSQALLAQVAVNGKKKQLKKFYLKSCPTH